MMTIPIRSVVVSLVFENLVIELLSGLAMLTMKLRACELGPHRPVPPLPRRSLTFPFLMQRET